MNLNVQMPIIWHDKESLCRIRTEPVRLTTLFTILLDLNTETTGVLSVFYHVTNELPSGQSTSSPAAALNTLINTFALQVYIL